METHSKQPVSVISNRPVLVVEDTKANQELLKALCKKIEIPCDVADNGAVALEMAKEHSYPLYIVDLMMPVMDGQTFIARLREFEPDAIILVQTALDTSNSIIPVMKMGVFDYIVKPIDPEIFAGTIFKALDYFYLKKFQKDEQLKAGERVRSQIDWLSYKESRRISDEDNTDTKSVYNLKTSLSQGAGFGSLVTLVDMMTSTAEKDDGFYRIDSQIFDMIRENNAYCRLQMEGLHFASDTMDHDIPVEDHHASELIAELPIYLSKAQSYLPEKKLRLTLPTLHDNCILSYNPEKIAIVTEELLINAYKYAIPGSTINVFTRISEGYFWLSFKNDVFEKPYGGVPEKYEKLVIEPFFRIQPPDESAARFERIGFGLGLAVTDYILKKHNGLFIIHDVHDLTEEKKRLCVLSEILLPVKQML